MTEIILTSSVLILLLAVLRRITRGRISPCAQYALWLLAAARLLIPGTLFSAPVSVLGAAEQLQTSILLADPPAARLPAEESELPTDGPSAPFVTQPEDGPSAPVVTLPADEPPAAFTTEPPVLRAEDLLDRVWKAGIVITGSAMAVSNLVFYLRLRKSRKLLALPAASWAGKLPVYEAEGLPSPCLFGLLRPAIYFNEAAMGAAHPEHILAHEYAHYRHGDHLWSILRSVCLAVHWYNPLVWWAAALSRRDCELACDASALRRLGEAERIDYGQTLLGMVSKRTSPAALLHTATTMTAGKRAMTERIALIVKAPRTRKITLAAVALLACVLAACTFGGGNGGPSRESDPALLEVPGLHWNDSMETVIETLGITEDQIVSTESSNEDSPYLQELSLVVKDFPFLGGTAQYAFFYFVQYAEAQDGPGLVSVRLDYPDGMDFAPVREQLIRQYGDGSESPPEFHTLSESGTIQPLGNSNSLSMSSDFSQQIYGEELLDRRNAILEQPGPHRWFWTSDPGALSDAFVQGAAAWLVEARTNGANSRLQPPTRETAEEFFRLEPMVFLWWTDAAPISVLRPATTVNQVQWQASEYVMFLQNAGAKDAPAGQTEPTALMEYPGLHWNDTPEAVMETLGITEEDMLEKAAMDNGETCRTWEFVVENPGFDPDAQYAIFHFSQYRGTGHGLGLDLVKLCYPEDTKDFDALRDAFVERYGESGKLDYGPYTGQVVADSLDDHHIKREIDAILGDRGGRWEELEAQEGPHCFFWDVNVDALPKERSEAFAEVYQASDWQSAYPGPSSENIPEYPAMVRLSWEDNSLERFTFNEVTYDARNYVLLLQSSSPLENASSLYEFPGLHWNDSMETVMETLGITEEDFVESGEENSSDTQNGFYFVIGDVPLNGHTAQYLICRFIQYQGTGHEPGLYAVQVNYPDDMEDFDTVREELLRQYGPADEETRGRGYPATDGFKAALGDRYGRWEELQQQTGNNTVRWKAGAEVLPEAYMGPLETVLKSWQTMHSDATMEDYVAEFPVASLTWCSASVFTPTFNTVTFNGGSYVYCLQSSSVSGSARNAGIIVSQVQGGGDPRGWLPYLNYMDWADIRQAAVDAGVDDGDGSGFAQNVLEDIAGYVDRRSPVIEESAYVSILTATEGLNDDLLEAYRFLVYRLHAANPSMFAHVVLEQLPQEQKDFILDCFRYEYRYEMTWEHTPGDGKNMPSREEAVAELEREMAGTVTAAPEEMVLTQKGQSFRFLPENAHGVYAATYSSNNPAVAEVAQDGTVTARNYGETYIILHFEGAQGQMDFSCHVRCELDGGAEAAAASIRSQVQAGVSPREWIPLLEEISWNELNVPEDGHDWIADVQRALYDYILAQRTRTGSALPDDERLTLLSCTDGLDGAYAEGYSVILYAIYNLHPSVTARDILRYLSPEQQEETLGLLFFEWGYHHRLGDDLSYEEGLDLLRKQLEADRNNSLPLYPDALLFTSVGTVSQIHLVRPYDTVYVSCESSDPEVASVEARGDGIFDVTAVGPGEAAITVHCRNGGEDRDAVCSVVCSW